MIRLLRRYTHWLHGRWPAGIPEALPIVGADGSTSVPGVLIAGDLAGTPLLTFAAHTGAAAADRCLRELDGPATSGDVLDVVVIGAGVAGLSAAVRLAQAPAGLTWCVVESTTPLATIADFSAGKPIFAYPLVDPPPAPVAITGDTKEALLASLHAQIAPERLPIRRATVTAVRRQGGLLVIETTDGPAIRARRVILAIGRSGDHRRLGVPGDDLPQVRHRLHDPATHHDRDLVVVGGGDSACEAAVACAQAGARVVLVHRGGDLSRAKPANQAAVTAAAAAGRLRLILGATLTAVTPTGVMATIAGRATHLPAQDVLSCIGRTPPLALLRRSGIAIHGERSRRLVAGLTAALLAIAAVYGWKTLGWGAGVPWLQPGTWLAGARAAVQDPTSITGVLLASASSPSFWVTLAYSAAVVGFGIDRMRHRRTPYVRVQTLTLMGIQVLPLFLIPELLLPWLGANDLVPQIVRDQLFPGDSWWRAYGFLLAWPLMAWNVCTEQPYTWWLVISGVQTLVIIPLLVWRWGKGAYCGWICSCGALAETLGDRHRTKMPHGPVWNRLNLVGQVVLAAAVLILGLHILAWSRPDVVSPAWVQSAAMAGLWKHGVDWLLAGALGTGLYFWLSGRVWCRFACPLAAWMHILARFSRFRILADGKKCISCNACTTTCHQGIDIMAFAQRGRAMDDPQCVRCSACVAACPTDVLRFGAVDGQGQVIAVDGLSARPVAQSLSAVTARG
jgi:NosR/NirI family transcriptional regulator, nitrous oxide reductase regulator